MVSGALPPGVFGPRRATSSPWRLLVAGLALVGIFGGPFAGRGFAQLVAGANINMVGGPASVSAGPPFKISGDPYLQRQNEPSIACSSRNPLNCLGAANDYRLVDTEAVSDGRVTGDAWIGVFWTHDQGQTWRSSLLPGFPQDVSAAAIASPITGLGAAADPTVRAGTSGLFFVSGVAFNRSGESSTGPGGKTGALFVSSYIDDNNAQTADTPVRYLRTVMVDSGNNGQFLDKPWIAVDIPRSGKQAKSCTISGSDGIPDQVVPAPTVYLAYSTFLGSGSNQHSKILFTRSGDCGQTWATVTKLNESFSVTSQSAMVAVDPKTAGRVMVAWRQFGDPNLSDQGRILVAVSTDYGATFTKGTSVAALGLANASSAYDQGSLPVPGDTNPVSRMFRTNGYPAICLDTAGTARIVWAQRFPTASDDSRILMATSTDGGTTWSPPAIVDLPPNTLDASSGNAVAGRGNQFMPTIACGADSATIAWYDQRNDLAKSVYAQWWWPAIFDVIPLAAHTIDVRALRVPAPTSARSISVSRYQYGVLVDGTPIQLETNPVNWPLFSKGTVPFLGDYIDIAAVNPYKPPAGKTGWTFNDDRTESQVFLASWADNRDVPKPARDNWGIWAPPGTPACAPPTYDPPLTGADLLAEQALFARRRNQNVYSARLSRGLVVGAPGNSRVVAGTSQRAYTVFAQNATPGTKSFGLRIDSGTASFSKTTTTARQDVQIPGSSTLARTLFVTGSSSVLVSVFETDGTPGAPAVAGGLSGKVIINADPTAPPPTNTDVFNGNENYAPALSDASVLTYSNPTGVSLNINGILDFANPTLINPTFLNPTFLNPTFLNPTFLNPTFLNPTFLNPTFLNPTFLNPTFLNPTFLNPTFLNQPLGADESWLVSNAGNVASGYDFSALGALPAGAIYQLLITRIYASPAADACAPGVQWYTDVLSSAPAAAVPAGTSGSPTAVKTSFALAAGDAAVVTLKVAYSTTGSFDPGAVTALVAAQASPGITARTAPLISVPTNLQPSEATSPAGAAVTYNVTAQLADGTAVPSVCTPVSGSTFAVGPTSVSCSASDTFTDPATGTSVTKASTATFTVTVQDTTAPLVTLPAGTVGGLLAEATGPTGAPVSYGPASATDLVDGPLVATCVPGSGSQFQLGATTVTCSATDARLNTGTAAFTVTVRDTTAPTLSTPANVTVTATSAAGAVVAYPLPIVTDIVSTGLVASCTPVSGSTFPLGTTTVVCTAKDGAGNSATPVAFNVVVVAPADTTAPVIAPMTNITVSATSAAGAAVTYTLPSVTDDVSTGLVASCNPAPGNVFPIGVTTVTCTAKDGAGNSAIPVTFAISVVDRTSPIIAEVANPNTLIWSPNKIMTPVTISGTVSDYSAITSVTFNVVDEYGKIQPSGTVTVGATGAFSFVILLEAWRQGTDANGRVYTVNIVATDVAGNIGRATTTVLVPHSQ